MSPEERAADIMRRCWWRPEEHPGEEYPGFAGLDVEIARAIREAVEEERAACAQLADREFSTSCVGPIIAANIRARKE